MRECYCSPVLAVLLLLTNFNEYQLVLGQRVAPGVPPQHYQAPGQQNFDPNQKQHQQFQPPQHQQQQFQGQPPPPQHQQQFQQQQFQQPPQHAQQHVPHQQVQQQGQLPPPAAGGHGHAHAPHHGQQPLLDTSNIKMERQHIQEHMDVPIDTSQMSEQELQFHYFKMHDADNNNKLDGCELVKSLIHWHDASNHDHRGGQPIPEAKIFTDQELINMIDPILQNDDKNGDGFIDYAEFSLAQASAAARAKTP